MARKHQRATRASTRARGLKVFAALLAGMTLAFLVTQYHLLIELARSLSDRAKAGYGPPERAVEVKPPPRAAPQSTPSPEPQSEEGTVATPLPEGQFVPSDGAHDCPPEFPIKGNANSRIYHLPGGGSYNATIPNICFASEEAAEAAGFRPPKR